VGELSVLPRHAVTGAIASSSTMIESLPIVARVQDVTDAGENVRGFRVKKTVPCRK